MLGAINPRSRPRRWGLKVAIAMVVTTLVLFPRVDLLVRNIGHWARLDLLIEPDAPGLDVLEARIRERMARNAAAAALARASEPGGDPSVPDAAADAAEVLRVTEEVVYEAVPYAWDWETWWVADYVPRVEETLRAGQEDCDGQAVVAASLLRRMGYDARLMSDLGHVWVWTPQGESMSPSVLAGGVVFVTQDERGSHLDWGAVLNLRAVVFDWARNVSYGIAVFPAWREGVLIACAWGLLLAPRPRWGGALVGLGLLVSGWLLIRWMCADFWQASIGSAWGGLGLAAVGVVATLRSAARPDGAAAEPDRPIISPAKP